MKKLLLLVILFISSLTYASSISIDSLRKQVAIASQSEKYDASIQLLTSFLSDKTTSASDRYEAYLLKAGIYRKLYKYEHALYFLNQALQEGIKGVEKNTVEQEIKAERSFIYFDKQEFALAEKLTNELEATHFRYLKPKYLLFLYTQKGYFLLTKKKYTASEATLHKAREIALKHFPAELPIIYGKQIELYHLTRDTVKRDAAYKEGLKWARNSDNIKYEFYLEEIMKNVFSRSNDYKNAFYHQKRCDSLFSTYDSNIKSSRIELLEQRLKQQEYAYGLQKRQDYLLAFAFSSVLLLLLLFFMFKLYKNTKEKNFLIEEENQRIREDIRYHVELEEQNRHSKNSLSDYPFTERQLQIIELVLKGRSNKEIAAELFISENTVKYHLKTIYGILNIKQRNELLILYAS